MSGSLLSHSSSSSAAETSASSDDFDKTRVFLLLLLADAGQEEEVGNLTKGEAYKVENLETVDGVVEEIEEEGGEMSVSVEINLEREMADILFVDFDVGREIVKRLL